MKLMASCLILGALAFSQGPHIVNVPCCNFVDSVSGTNVTTVPVGTTVQWVLSGVITHTMTSGTGPTDPASGVLFNGTVDTTTTTFSFTFTTPGTIPYYCIPHFNFGMTGTVNVTVPASATPSGNGCVGSSGAPLTLSAVGLPVIGSPTFAVNISGGPSNGLSLWFAAIGLQNPPIFLNGNCTLQIDFVTFNLFLTAGITPVPIPLSSTGTGTLPFPVPTNFAPGTRLDLQAACQDSIPGGFITSNAMTLIFGV